MDTALVFLDFDFGGLTESDWGSLCFPRVRRGFPAVRELASFVGKAAEAQPRPSPRQAQDASLNNRKKTILVEENIALVTGNLRRNTFFFFSILSSLYCSVRKNNAQLNWHAIRIS